MVSKNYCFCCSLVICYLIIGEEIPLFLFFNGNRSKVDLSIRCINTMKIVTKSMKKVLNEILSFYPERSKEDAIESVFKTEKVEYTSKRSKEIVTVCGKTTLALAGIVMNPEIVTPFISAGVAYAYSKPNRPNSPKHIKVRNLLKQFANLSDVSCAKTLSDIDDETTRNMVEASLTLCSNVTGVSVEDIVKLQFEYTGHNIPCGVEDDSVLYWELEPEERVPSLNSRIALAYSAWANGDTPNKFGFNVSSIKDMKAYFNSLSDIKRQVMKQFKQPEDIKPEPLINEDGSIRYK